MQGSAASGTALFKPKGCTPPVQVVQELLRVGPMLNAIDADGCSALHLAAQDGRADIVRLLKEHGCVDGLPDLKGRCPSDLARLHGHAAIARTLAEGAVSKVCTAPTARRETPSACRCQKLLPHACVNMHARMPVLQAASALIIHECTSRGPLLHVLVVGCTAGR